MHLILIDFLYSSQQKYNDGMHAVPAFSYISTNSEFNPVVTDLRQLLKHQPIVHEYRDEQYEKQNNLQKQQMNHQQQQQQQHQHQNNAIVIGISPMPNGHKLNKQQHHHAQQPQQQQAPQQKQLDEKNRKQNKKDKKEKNNKKEKKDKNLNNSSPTSSLPDNKNIQLIAMKRNVQHHEYYNIIEEQKNINNEMEGHPQFRKFGDTNLLMKNKKNLNMNNENRIQNGDYKNGKNITTFAAIETKHLDALLDESTINRYSNLSMASKFLNFDIKSPRRKNSLESPSSTSSNSNSSKNSSSLSSLDIIEQAIINQHRNSGESHLGPFNFRQLLRPTQGPTESLRKRKGINPPSPPPPQRGKSFA